MNKTLERWLEKFQRKTGVLRNDQQGQALIIVAIAFFVLLAFVGLGIDLGLVYVERVRVAQAADAAALAAAPELPTKEAAHMRALIYLQGNGYDYEAADTKLAVDTYTKDGKYPVDPGGETTIWIDTAYAQESGAGGEVLEDTANRIKVRVRRQVFMTFMQFVGFSHFPVEATAEAENINRVDTTIVYDRSGSMEYNTLCYGCWGKEPDIPYPSGSIFPLPWSSTTTTTADHCADDCEDTDYVLYDDDTDYQVNDCNYYHEGDDQYYIVVEAEEYSDISVDYHSDYYAVYKTYWVVQRNAENAAFQKYEKWDIEDVEAMGRDGRGAYLSHHPYRDAEDWLGGLGVACSLDALQDGERCRDAWSSGRPDGTLMEQPYPTGMNFAAPRADYEFYAPRADNYYFWIRGQAAVQQTRWGLERNNRIFWGINNRYSEAEEEGDFPLDVGYDGAIGDSWDWRCLGTKNLSAGDVTLNLWAGGAGFDVDRILITTNDRGNACSIDREPPGGVAGFAPNNGRTDRACDGCDPRFAGRPGGHVDPYRPYCPRDTRYDDIYDDEQPIREALEAAKYYAGMWDPLFDQVGYVSYANEAVIECELQCLRDPSVGACNSAVITDTVIAALDKTRAGGGTNIADGIAKGIEVLSSSEIHYGRPGAAHIMVLLTDGQANLYPDNTCWRWSVGGGATNEEKAAACVVYYAQQAANSDILIYTITLGWGADQDLMKQVAEITKGKHFHAPDASALNSIFEELYKLVFVRLVQ
jgi:hypothetical protein